MADDTYGPLVYMKQGGDEQVIADGGKISLPVVTDTTAANMSNFGVSSIANASSGLSTFILDAPSAGTQKFIRCDGTFGSTAIGYIDAGSGVTISSTARYMSVKSAYATTMHLVGLSATAWMVASAVGSTASTGSTG